MGTLLVDLLGFLFHRRGGSPLQIFAALPECQVLTLDGSQQKHSPRNTFKCYIKLNTSKLRFIGFPYHFYLLTH